MSEKVVIIAEAGVNHNGSLETAKRLIEIAAEAGADFVKFQTFKADRLVSKTARKADYQQKNIRDGDDSQYAMLKKLELSEADHVILKEHARKNSIRFFSTAFDEEAVDFLEELGIEIWKIPSGEITNLPYLRKIATLKKPTILSTGMASMEEIGAAMDILLSNGLQKKDITVLHCNTEYPTPFTDVNLRAMNAIGQHFGVKVGYSDHTMGIEVPVAAVALGATCIEKHFTLDRTMEGPDHMASLEPAELKMMVSAVRNVEDSLKGTGRKEPSASESKNKAVARKSIHLNKTLQEGHVLSENDLIMKRPGTGISPMNMDSVVGKKLVVNLEADTMLDFSHLAP